jgi:DNA-binding GntR family transcriptional regulator
VPETAPPTTAAATRPGDTVEAVYRELRDLIVQGAFGPNERLTHGELSERFGVGRTPVRQALHRLEADGLVVSTPNRGVRVAPATIAYAEELYAARLIMEPPLLAALAGVLTAEELGRMREHLAAMEANVDRARDFQVAHRDFHLVAAADYSSPFIADLVIRVHRHLFRHQQIYLSRPRVPADILSLDRSLLEALERGDSTAARHIYEFHLIELALGMILDVDPDHEFDVLLRVAAATDIAIETTDGSRIARPARLRWTNRLPTPLPPLSTANLLFEPE